MLLKLQNIIGYEFKNPELLVLALTHQSANAEKNYERLEFLGDSILSFIICEILIDKYPNDNEGGLAVKRSALVNSTMLAQIGEQINLFEHIIKDITEEINSRQRIHIIEDVMEALIGAIYMDSRDINKCRTFISKNWSTAIEEHAIHPPIESKTFLQEWTQSHGLGIPSYSIVSREGSDHTPLFTVRVAVKDMQEFEGTGYSKKDAEKKAAQAMINHINKNL